MNRTTLPKRFNPLTEDEDWGEVLDPPEIMYGISIENLPGEYGMTDGPTPNLMDLLHKVPYTEPHKRTFIVRFVKTRTKAPPMTKLLYRWKDGEWVQIEYGRKR